MTTIRHAVQRRRARWTFLLGALIALLPVESLRAQDGAHPLVNADIIKMGSSGFSEEVTVAMIEANESNFDVSVAGLTALKDAGVSPRVMEAMAKAAARQRASAKPGASPAEAPASGAAPGMAMPPGMPARMPSGIDPAVMAGMAGMNGAANVQQMMAMAMAMRGGQGALGMPGGAGASLDASQLPPVKLISDAASPLLHASVAQIAHTDTKGGGMPGVGSAAGSALLGLGQKALTFGAIGGSMMAGPGVGLARSAAGGVLGSVGGMFGMGHHGPSMPKVTYVWALPGRQAPIALPGSKPKFEMAYGDLLGIDPDAYQPMLIKLVSSKDNWRLIGATESTMGQMTPEAYDKVTEERVAVQLERVARGVVRIEPKTPLATGEYGVVLRAMHPGKRSEGSLGGGVESTIFFSVWDFTVGAPAH